MKTSYSLIASAILAATLTACGGSSSSSAPTTPTTPTTPTMFDFDAVPVISNLTLDVIVAGYEELNLSAETLHTATLNLLNAKTPENLAAAQQAWKDARQPWEQGESHIFGPVDALSVDPHLDTWPLNTADLQTILSTQSGFSADEILTWNDDIQGFHTMEYLLFGDGVADNEKTIAEMTDKEYEYLAAAAEVFSIYTQNLYDAWTVSQNLDGTSTAYKDELLTTGNNIYASNLAVMEELLNGMIGIVDEVGNGKIAEPFGSAIETADTSLVESQYSWNSLDDFSNNITGVQNVYRGEFSDNSDMPGFMDFVAAGDQTLATRVDGEIVAAIAAIQAIAGDNDMPFRQAILDVDARVRIQASIDALSVLQASLEGDVTALISDWNAN